MALKQRSAGYYCLREGMGRSDRGKGHKSQEKMEECREDDGHTHPKISMQTCSYCPTQRLSVEPRSLTSETKNNWSQ